MGDQYIAKQVGIQGKEAGSHGTIVQNYHEYQISDTDVQQMLSELERIKEYLLNNYSDNEHYIMVGNVSSASKSLTERKNNEAMEFLKKAGKSLFDIAKSIGCAVVARYLGNFLGL